MPKCKVCKEENNTIVYGNVDKDICNICKDANFHDCLGVVIKGKIVPCEDNGVSRDGLPCKDCALTLWCIESNNHLRDRVSKDCRTFGCCNKVIGNEICSDCEVAEFLHEIQKTCRDCLKVDHYIGMNKLCSECDMARAMPTPMACTLCGMYDDQEHQTIDDGFHGLCYSCNMRYRY